MDETLPQQPANTSTPDRDDEVLSNLRTLPSRSVDAIPGATEAENRASALHAMKLKDHGWKISARKIYGRWFVGMLVVQNIAVYVLLFFAYFQGRLADMPVVFTLIINGTLAETYFIIKIMVQWLFTDIKYDNKPN